MVEPARQDDITKLLRQWRNGDASAGEEVSVRVYDELKRNARAYLRKERRDLTLQPTELVDCAFMRLIKSKGGQPSWQDRAHFYKVASNEMKRVLVDMARARKAQKRDALLLTLNDQVDLGEKRALEAESLNDALDALESLHPRRALLVEALYFGGLTLEEAAKNLDISRTTASREWALARKWLHRYMAGSQRFGF